MWFLIYTYDGERYYEKFEWLAGANKRKLELEARFDIPVRLYQRDAGGELVEYRYDPYLEIHNRLFLMDERG